LCPCVPEAQFDKETGVLINSFLACLPKRLWLAHNGGLYDFPLLKEELEKAGVTLHYDTLCADSYVGITEIFNRSEDALGKPTYYSLINLQALEKKPTLEKNGPQSKNSTGESSSAAPQPPARMGYFLSRAKSSYFISARVNITK
jgi:hypothetical protein